MEQVSLLASPNPSPPLRRPESKPVCGVPSLVVPETIPARNNLRKESLSVNSVRFQCTVAGGAEGARHVMVGQEAERRE